MSRGIRLLKHESEQRRNVLSDLHEARASRLIKGDRPPKRAALMSTCGRQPRRVGYFTPRRAASTEHNIMFGHDSIAGATATATAKSAAACCLKTPQGSSQTDNLATSLDDVLPIWCHSAPSVLGYFRFVRALKLVNTLSGKRQAHRTPCRLRQRDDEHTHVVKVSQQAELLASIAAASGPAATRFSRRAGCKTHHAILALDAHAEVAPFHEPLGWDPKKQQPTI